MNTYTGQAPSRAVQEAEAEHRRAQSMPPDAETPPEPETDRQPELAPQPPLPDPGAGEEGTTETVPARVMSPGDQARAEMAARMRARRRGELTDFDGDATKPDNFFGDLLKPAPARASETPPRAPSDQPESDGRPPSPEKVKLKVRHTEVELTPEQRDEAARKYLATESYFDESKQLLDHVKAVTRDAMTQGEQPPAPAPSEQPEPDQPPQAEEYYRTLVEKLQYGDPDEAGRALQDLVENRRPKLTEADIEEVMLQRRFKEDVVRTRQGFDEFLKDPRNRDIVEDKDAWRVIEGRVIDKYREEIMRLGLLPEDKLPTTSVDLANFHGLLKLKNFKVSEKMDLVRKAVDEYRDRYSPQRNQSAAPRPAAPRVEVNRTERRERLPMQPTRSASPQPDPGASSGLSRNAEAVRRARIARGLPV